VGSVQGNRPYPSRADLIAGSRIEAQLLKRNEIKQDDFKAASWAQLQQMVQNEYRLREESDMTASSAEPFLAPLHCALCGGSMKLVRRIPASDALSQLAVYQCEQCQYTVTVPAEEKPLSTI
jgi:hypothetical protein